MKSIKLVFAIAIVTIIAYVILGECVLPKEALNGEELCEVYGESWYCLENGLSIGLLKEQGKLREPVWSMQTTLPKELPANVSCLMFRGNDFQAYLDGEQIFVYDTANSRYLGDISPERYLPIPVSKEDAGKTLRIEFMNGAKLLYPCYIGNEWGIWMFLLKENRVELGSAFVMMVLGLLTVCVSLIYNIFGKRKVPLGYLGLAVIIVAFWLITNSECRQLLFSNLSVASDFAFFAVMMIPFPFVIYLNEIQKKRYEKVYFLAMFLLTCLEVYVCTTYVMGTREIVDTFPLVTVGCFLCILVLLYGIIMDAKNKWLKEYKYVAYGLLVVFFMSAVQMILYFARTGIFHGTFLLFGIFMLLCGATVHTFSTVFALEKEKTAALMANEAKSAFLANMSHEIRTPINAVLGMDEMILRECSEESIREYALDIQRAGRSLLALVNEILDISKIDSGKMEIVPVIYNQNSLIHDTLNLVQQKADEKHLPILLEVDSSLPSGLYGDDIRIQQILSNILNNAVKYTNQGKVILRIQGQCIAEENSIWMEYQVEDTGIGIQEKDLPKLFEAFERIDLNRNRSVEGTGLGMSITARLVKLMGGVLDVKSTYGVGTCFTVRIRQGVVDFTPIGDLSERILDKKNEYHQFFQRFTAKDAKILLVDDNAINRKVVMNLLKQSLIHIDDVDSGATCLSMIAKEKYDIIFLDHMMPIMDGIETLERFRKTKNNQNADTPVIVLTANAVAGAKEMYLQKGFSDFLAKPIACEKLESLLLKYLPEEKINWREL